MRIQFLLFNLYLFLLNSCTAQQKPSMNKDVFPPQNEQTIQLIADQQLYENYSYAVFASGCFWCVEPVFDSVIGVKDTFAGYSGGHTDYVNYDLSNTGKTGHAEAVLVFYDSSIVSFEQLVDVYFASHNYFQVMGQGPDKGSQYRSIAFYQNEEEKATIDLKIALIESEENQKVATEVKAFERFFVAEDYHQDFKKRNGSHPYIQAISNPRFERFKEKMKGNK